ncbi:MAG: cytochrome c3 family protein [Deltaproteobacteria bacterium]|nr:cytochrome c3 family protein [Deltaproteobacteria bacterium]MBW2015594.1 cytochrome c3 family protein [Deltaproteobacteria bacterium]MBW2128092.1 cytochrome c3 family protein [Deltaproteobacteria bacterium]MBW2303003.1 cytochrome c3 family protein [Deltaproteobacteria bacterium]
MGVRKEQIVAYWIAGIFFVIGVVCYAAFPEKAPEQPVRIMFKSTGGKVLFSHKVHTSDEGYGIECMDCHHDLEEEGDLPAACGECHEPDSEDPMKRSDALHTQCIGCHKEEGGGPVDCNECHML